MKTEIALMGTILALNSVVNEAENYVDICRQIRPARL